MAHRLSESVTSRYLAAASRLRPKKSKRKVVVYVESYDDILFWHAVFSEIETPEVYFEVMLPSKTTLGKGKKVALMNALNAGLGENLIVCVDADYDYMMQGATETSKIICENPWVFHTIVYAIESYQCYAPSLHTVCVMATLNDKFIFNFENFLEDYSKIVFPLFVWSVWCYRFDRYSRFNMHDMNFVTHLDNVNLDRPDRMLEVLQRRVNQKIAWLQRHFPEAKENLKSVEADVLRLGVTRETTYMFMRGHDVFDNVVFPLVEKVCKELTNERQNQIRRLALHETQKNNELLSYEHSSAGVEDMMRKQMEYKDSPLYRRMVETIKERLGFCTGVQKS